MSLILILTASGQVTLAQDLDPVVVGTWPTTARNVAVARGFAFYSTGNPGLGVIDIRDPRTPSFVASYETTAPSFSPVALSGDHLFGLARPTFNALSVLNIADPAAPKDVGGCQLLGNLIRAFAIDGDHLFVASEDRGFYCVDVSSPSQPYLLGACSNVPYASAVAVSGDYACVVGRTNRAFHVVDIRHPSSPERIGGCALQGDTVAVAMYRNFAYVACESGGAALQVVDLSDPAEPHTVPQDQDFPVAPGLSDVDIVGDYAYLASPYVGLVVADLWSPAKPRRIAAGQTTDIARAVAVSGDQACIADTEGGVKIIELRHLANPPRQSVAFAFPVGDVASADGFTYMFSDGGINVFDVADPLSPQLVGRCEGIYGGYRVEVASGTVYVADRWDLKAIDVTEPSDPRQVGVFTPTGGAVVDVVLQGTLAYVANPPDIAGTGGEGLVILDVRDPRSPQRLSALPPADVGAVAVSGDYVFTVSRGALQVVDVSDPSSPRPLSQCLLPKFSPVSGAHRIHVRAGYAYVSDSRGLHIVDVSDPGRRRAKHVGICRGTATAKTVASSKSYLYVADSQGGLHVFDASDPVNLTRVGGNASFLGQGLAISNGRLYVSSLDQGLIVLGEYQRPPRLELLPWIESSARPLLLWAEDGQSVNVQRSRDFESWEDWRVAQGDTNGVELYDDAAQFESRQFYRAFVR